MTDSELIAGYLESMRWRRLATTTVDIRATYLAHLSRELGPLPTVKSKKLRAWLANVERDLQPSTQSVYLACYHGFYTWGIKNKRLKKDPTLRIDKPAVKKGKPHAITDEHKETALLNADELVKCWLSLGVFAGCRCKEIAFMCREDVDDGPADLEKGTSGTLFIANGKGDKSRYVPLKTELLEALTAWGMPAAGRLWELNPQQMSKAINTYLHGMDALRNDGKPATAHCLRHWYASTLYQLTKDIVLVKELLGHESVATTQIYAGADMSKSAEWVGKL